jgi:hypothetical protein
MRVLTLRILAALVTSVATPAFAQQKINAEPMREMRDKVLTLAPADVGIDRKKCPQDVWAALMETGYDTGVVSLVMFCDGTTSLYFSTGGGVIGAGGTPSVSKATRAFLAQASQSLATTLPSRTQPYPTKGKVIFYFVTFTGLRSYSAKEIDLGEGRDKLSDLFHAGHEVITKIRESQPATK